MTARSARPSTNAANISGLPAWSEAAQQRYRPSNLFEAQRATSQLGLRSRQPLLIRPVWSSAQSPDRVIELRGERDQREVGDQRAAREPVALAEDEGRCGERGEKA